LKVAEEKQRSDDIERRSAALQAREQEQAMASAKLNEGMRRLQEDHDQLDRAKAALAAQSAKAAETNAKAEEALRAAQLREESFANGQSRLRE
jgi:hypothetical protein